MERHIALDCQGVDAQAKVDMQQHLFNKKLHTLEKKGVKRKHGEASSAPSEGVQQMLDPVQGAAQGLQQIPAYSGEAAGT
jgi:hypothetical protein